MVNAFDSPCAVTAPAVHAPPSAPDFRLLASLPHHDSLELDGHFLAAFTPADAIARDGHRHEAPEPHYFEIPGDRLALPHSHAHTRRP
jgi:hypothetical protein